MGFWVCWLINDLNWNQGIKLFKFCSTWYPELELVAIDVVLSIYFLFGFPVIMVARLSDNLFWVLKPRIGNLVAFNICIMFYLVFIDWMLGLWGLPPSP